MDLQTLHSEYWVLGDFVVYVQGAEPKLCPAMESKQAGWVE